MIEFDLSMQGFDGLQQSMQQFAKDLKENALETALVAGARVVRDEMQNQAPRSHDIGPRLKADQHVADNIVIKVEKKPIGSDAEVYVGPRKSVTAKARWLELGAAAHAIANKLSKRMMKLGVEPKTVLASPEQIFGTHVEHPGIHPQPFMRPALDTAGKGALAAIRDSLAKSVRSAARRANRKAQS